jgi:hypothetical protein
MKKLIFALFIVAALVVVAMPAAAQGPNPYVPLWYDRTPEMGKAKAWLDAGGDPPGGYPLLEGPVRYEADATGKVVPVGLQAAWPYAGIVAKFGLTPYSNILPGGIPSNASGDGSSPNKAIYIGGAWADNSVNPRTRFLWDPNTMVDPHIQGRYSNENPYEIPACATFKVAAGTNMIVKLDTWSKDSQGNRIQTKVWLDDELDGAKKFSGSAVFGAANKWFIGTSNYGDGWSVNYTTPRGNQQDANKVQGYVMKIIPSGLEPNMAYPPPNAEILTGGCTSAVYAGQSCVQAPSGGPSNPAGASSDYWGYQALANFNPNQPSHLLWADGNWDGWVYAQIWNQMIWDGMVTVCSFRDNGTSP